MASLLLPAQAGVSSAVLLVHLREPPSVHHGSAESAGDSFEYTPCWGRDYATIALMCLYSEISVHR